MNRRGFTLVELLATLVVLGIIMGIVVVSVNGNFGKAKNQTEDVFVATIEDALDVYLANDAKKLSFNEKVCTLSKTHGEVDVYKTTINFGDVINSELHPIAQSDLVNPANKEVRCNNGAVITVNVYRDSDYVYYYSVDREHFGCLKIGGKITNLPEECK